jgi:hypothetical protein
MSSHEQDVKMIEQMLEREAKNDAVRFFTVFSQTWLMFREQASLKHAVRDLEAAEKAEVKAEKVSR